ncbi:MAG: hypothetical protein KXJ51_11635, partial [Sediminibacterium sp.]|jgi:hypothetical protein|nr:hypothetical protein [Sediminibacterium sp.]
MDNFLGEPTYVKKKFGYQFLTILNFSKKERSFYYLYNGLSFKLTDLIKNSLIAGAAYENSFGSILLYTNNQHIVY